VPIPKLSWKERIIGCLFGGALGDACGGPWEGIPGPVEFAIPQKLVLSDDTQLTLATCDSIIECGCVNPENIAAHFLRWFRHGRIRGMGSSTLKAMRDLNAGVHWAVSGARGEFAAGNGAAMRIAPLAFVLNPVDPAQRAVIRDACRITHNHDEAYAGALAVVLAIRSVLSGAWSRERSFLAVAADGTPDSRVRDRMFELLPFQDQAPDIAKRFGSGGYVVESVPLALYCAQSIARKSLPAVLEEAIRAGGDTDTIASIAGQVAGTVAGANEAMVRRIEGSEELVRIAGEFATRVATLGPRA
jgi:ADP-ribosyl-[dinitrogen reductase] hydrolase